MKPQSLVQRVLDRVKPPTKDVAEMRFWRERAAEEGTLTSDHYERAFTTHFELQRDFYTGKRILDIGCGPRGSLEWATMAAVRVGVDPLADEYREFGIERHAMEYVAAPAEELPLADGSFDVVAALNSLDHVDDVPRTINEIDRVAAADATILLMVEIGHQPTPAEPQSLDWSIIDEFRGWKVEWSARNAIRSDHNLYASIDENRPFEAGVGLLRARLIRA